MYLTGLKNDRCRIGLAPYFAKLKRQIAHNYELLMSFHTLRIKNYELVELGRNVMLFVGRLSRRRHRNKIFNSYKNMLVTRNIGKDIERNIGRN